MADNRSGTRRISASYPDDLVYRMSPAEAEQVELLRAAALLETIDDQTSFPSQGLRGLLTGHLNDALEGDERRHLFLRAVTGATSSKALSKAWANVLLEFIRRPDGPDLGNRIVHAALAAEGQMPLPIPPLPTIPPQEEPVTDQNDNVMPAQAAEPEPPEVSAAETQPPVVYPPVQVAEAPVLFWTKFQKGPGLPAWTISIRGGLTLPQMKQSLRDTLAVVAQFEKWLNENEYAPIYDGRDQVHFPDDTPPPATGGSTRTPAPPSGPPSPSAGPPRPPAARTASQPAPQNTSGEGYPDSFEVATLEAALTQKGARFYLLKGGPFSKFGVKCWPEVAERDIEPIVNYAMDALEPGAPWDVKAYGMVARLEMNDEGKPTKVIAVEA